MNFSLGQKRENQRSNTMRPQHINKSQQYCCFLKKFCRLPGCPKQRTHLKGQKLTKTIEKSGASTKYFAAEC